MCVCVYIVVVYVAAQYPLYNNNMIACTARKPENWRISSIVQ